LIDGIRWVSNVEFSPGLSTDILRLINKNHTSNNDMQKVGIIGFDEMSISNLMSYYPKRDQILGPFKKVQVLSVRGLFGQWKYPVFYDFDTKMTISLLLQTIKKLHDTGLVIKGDYLYLIQVGIHPINYSYYAGIVCDNATDNQKLWKDLGICVDDEHNVISSFYHPVTGENVWAFSDFPHLMKLLRNKVIDNGFTLPYQEKLKGSDFHQLWKMDSGETKICYKLTEKHVTCQNKERMRVNKAFELFSHTVATAIHHLE